MLISGRNVLLLFSKLMMSTFQKTFFHQTANLIKIKVRQGVIVGQENILPNGNKYCHFLGIPYAVPPVGKLRFKSPVAIERYDVPKMFCLNEGDVCYQRNPVTGEIVGSENCLFLNIYTPNLSTTTKALPVMVWLHGGGFTFGDGNSDFYWPLHLLQEDVVVVTLNYRLGAFGFLVLPEAGIWGNAGLKDQRLALQWIHDNIEQFKGDPSNVTLFGESAGAASIHLHLISDHAEKLFHKAILQSGTANMEWIFQANPIYKTRRLAKLLHFPSNNAKALLDFLQSSKVTSLDILQKSVETLTTDEKRRTLPFVFKPIIEDANSPDCFLHTLVMERLKQNDIIRIPAIVGYNSAEGLTMLPHVLKNLDVYEKDFERLVPRNLTLITDEDMHKAADQIRQFYLSGESVTKEVANQMKDLLSDYYFNIALLNAVELWIRYQPNSNLYLYRFNYVGERNFYKRLLKMEQFPGACHGDELFYLFQQSNIEIPYNDKDLQFSQQLCKLWANFAYTGEPTPANRQNPINCQWLPTRIPNHNENEPNALRYLSIENTHSSMQLNPDHLRLEFWRDINRMHRPRDVSKLSSKL